MPAGFQAYDGQGRLTTDITDRFSLFITSGTLNLGWNQTATINVPGFDPNTWFVSVSQAAYVEPYWGYFTVRASQTFGFGTIYYTVWSS